MAEHVSVDHIGITVSDLDRAVKFYEEGLRFRKTDEFLFTAYKDGFFGESAQARTLYGVAEGSTCRLAMMVPESGDTVLELFCFSDRQPKRERCWTVPSYTHFCVRTDAFTAVCERLKAAGATFLMEPGTQPGGAYWVFLTDPEGNMIEVCGND